MTESIQILLFWIIFFYERNGTNERTNIRSIFYGFQNYRIYIDALNKSHTASTGLPRTAISTSWAVVGRAVDKENAKIKFVRLITNTLSFPFSQ